MGTRPKGSTVSYPPPPPVLTPRKPKEAADIHLNVEQRYCYTLDIKMTADRSHLIHYFKTDRQEVGKLQVTIPIEAKVRQVGGAGRPYTFIVDDDADIVMMYIPKFGWVDVEPG